MSNANSHLDSTIKALDGGLEKAKSGASNTINSWMETLNDSGDPALAKIAQELEDLGTLLGKGDASSAQLKKALSSLGKHTTAAAKQAEGATADKIKTLGQQLTDSADSL